MCLNEECVEDPDPPKKNVPPPKPMTRDEICRKYTGYPALTVIIYFEKSIDPCLSCFFFYYIQEGRTEVISNCKVLTCFVGKEGRIIKSLESLEPPAEGSECGFGGVDIFFIGK